MITETESRPRPSPRRLLAVWLAIGAQSFGGGAATLALIRQTLVVERKWITEAEYTEDWAMCQITPGINLLGFTIIIGRRLAGHWGIAASLIGLLLPSVVATALLTAFYARFAHTRVAEAALRGVIPAIVGISLVTALSIARPLLRTARREGTASLLFACSILIVSAGALFARAPVVLILIAAGIASGLWNAGQSKHRSNS